MQRARIAVLISGSGTNMAALLYASKMPDSSYEIVLVASNNPDAAGLALAKGEGIETYCLPHQGMGRVEHDAAMDAAIRASEADYIALAGYMRILGSEMVAKWEDKILNIHPSLLPKYKGLDTHERAIAAGDDYAGCSVHLVTPQLDAGQVLGQLKVAIKPSDTPDTLASRVLIAEHQLYSRVLADYVSRGSDPDYLLDRVRELALRLPQTYERESLGSPGWRVGTRKSGKYFAHFNDQHHGSDHIGVLVKASSMDELLQLVETRPDIYYKPAYYGASGWIGIILNRRDMDWDHMAEWLERSWRSVAPKNAARLMDAADRF